MFFKPKPQTIHQGELYNQEKTINCVKSIYSPKKDWEYQIKRGSIFLASYNSFQPSGVDILVYPTGIKPIAWKPRFKLVFRQIYDEDKPSLEDTEKNCAVLWGNIQEEFDNFWMALQKYLE